MSGIIDLDVLIGQAAALEPLPPSATRLAGLVASPDPDLDDVLDVVAYDQALTARLLRAANSAASGARQPIGTVRQAVVRMGMGAVLSVTMAASVRDRMACEVPEYRLAQGEFWRHSVAAAVAAEVLAEAGRRPLPPESFTAALLHDIGKLVLARQLDGVALAYLARAEEEGGRSRCEAEAELLGVHHGELGGLVAQHWHLPDSIVSGVTHHHDPETAGERVSDVVFLANVMAKRALGAAPEPASEPAERAAAERLDLEHSVAELAQRSVERFSEVVSRYQA